VEERGELTLQVYGGRSVSPVNALGAST
jgi:hypothetical protein